MHGRASFTPRIVVVGEKVIIPNDKIQINNEYNIIIIIIRSNDDHNSNNNNYDEERIKNYNNNN